MIVQFSTRSASGILPFFCHSSNSGRKSEHVAFRKIRCAQKSPGHMPDLARLSISPVSSAIVTTTKTKALVKKKKKNSPLLCAPSHLLPAWPHRASLTGRRFWHRASGQRSLPSLRSTGISVAEGSLPPFVVRPDIHMPKAPRTRLLLPSLVLCFFLGFFCPTNHGTTIFPMGHITIMQRSAVALLLGMKASCALCHEIGSSSAARTTAKSDTKKRFMIGEKCMDMDFLHVWWCIQFRACAAFALHHLEKLGASGVLQVCSTQQSLSSA